MNVRPALGIALLFVLLACHPHTRAAATDSDKSGAAEATAAFYRARLGESRSGLLDSAELQRRSPFLSIRLHQLYAEAIRHQQDWIRRHPAKILPSGPPLINKPPCVEGGDYFDSLAEWPDVKSVSDDPVQRFKVVRAEPNLLHESWQVDLHFWYDTTPRIDWIDRINVVKQNGKFVINDVSYAEGPFNRGGNLSALLRNCAQY